MLNHVEGPRKSFMNAINKFSVHLWVWLLLACTSVVAQEHYDVTIEQGVTMKTRDGVVLRADIYRPLADGRFPILLKRTPYGKNVSAGAGDKRVGVDWDWGLALKAARRGYVVIVQECRGTFTSDGEWYPFRDDIKDGYDAVEWAASLTYSNGKVGMWGMSYVGMTQLLAAIAAPPHLVGIFPVETGSNPHEDWFYHGGALAQSFTSSWASVFATDALNRRVWANLATTLQESVKKLPLTSYPFLKVGNTETLAPYYFDWLAHPSYDEYWKQLSIDESHAKILVPAFHVGGWYDLFLGGTLRNYMGLKAHGGNGAARSGQRLMVGPWTHTQPPYMNQQIGEIDFGPHARPNPDLDDIMLRWYDHVLKGIDNGVQREKPVKIFVMGKNIWRDEDDWPLLRAHDVHFYLHSEGRANGSSGKGAINTVVAENESADHYIYDPENPVPTAGPGAWHGDQRQIETRADVLVYSTSPFKDDFEVTGPITLELYASSSAADTDFTGKLVDVWPNGFAQNLTDGILRGRYRHSMEKTDPMNPGEVYKFTIDLWATSNVFLPGHRLRLEISSSNFPRFDRNLNTGESQADSIRMIKATNTIYHDHDHPSALILPVVSN